MVPRSLSLPRPRSSAAPRASNVKIGPGTGALRNWLISTPTSVPNCSATRCPMPGIASQISTASAQRNVMPPRTLRSGVEAGGTGVGSRWRCRRRRDWHNQRRDLRVKRRPLRVENVDVLQMAGNHTAMMLAHSTNQRLLRQLTHGPQPALRQLGQGSHIALSINACLPHRPGRHADDGGRHRRQLEIGPFQHLLQPVKANAMP